MAATDQAADKAKEDTDLEALQILLDKGDFANYDSYRFIGY